jgi:hypothetical protein
MRIKKKKEGENDTGKRVYNPADLEAALTEIREGMAKKAAAKSTISEGPPYTFH